jgi:hypothetical protein
VRPAQGFEKEGQQICSPFQGRRAFNDPAKTSACTRDVPYQVIMRNSSRACFLIRITIKTRGGWFATGAAGETHGRIDLTAPRTPGAVKDNTR